MFLQLLYAYGILVGHTHHSYHHEHPSTRYGVVLPVTNYVLDGLDIWRVLEALISIATGVEPHTKMPYSEYVQKVKLTEYHKDVQTNACPRVPSMQEVATIQKELDTYHSCSI
jgi:hypothetical protein